MASIELGWWSHPSGFPNEATSDRKGAADALAKGLPSGLGYGKQHAACLATQALEATRRQRSEQEALLEKARRAIADMVHHERQLATKAALQVRVGGAQPCGANTAVRCDLRLAAAGSQKESTRRASPVRAVAPKGSSSTPLWARATLPAVLPRQGTSPHRPSGPRTARGSSPPRSPRTSSPDRGIGPPARPHVASLRLDNSQSIASPRTAARGLTSGSSPRSAHIRSPRESRSLSPSAPNTARGAQQFAWADISQVTIDDEDPCGAAEDVIGQLLTRGLLTSSPKEVPQESGSAKEDLTDVALLFMEQVPNASVRRVLRVENSNLEAMHRALRDIHDKPDSVRQLWHGTSRDSLKNIVVTGFNRAYCGVHGTRLGNGTYFSAKADYSTRYCDRDRHGRVMLLAEVVVGSWTKGYKGLVEPPYLSLEEGVRFDSTVDDIDDPSIFCVFRDFQALPRFVIEFDSL